MSAWHSEIREEGVKWACFAEGGIRDPRMEHIMVASYQEARDWVDAAYIRKTTPKVKKPVEPTTAEILAAMNQIGVGDNQWLDGAVPDGGVVVNAENRDPIEWPAAKPAAWPSDGPDAPEPPEAAETATGDQAGSAMPSAVESMAREEMGAVKRRGRPPKVSA